MGSKTRLGSYCTKRANNGVNLVTSRNINTRLARPIVQQWNPSFEATLFAPENWPFKRGGLLSMEEINTFMFRFTLSSGLSRGVGLLSEWPLKRGSTVY